MLFNEIAAFPGYELTIDLDRQVIVRPQGEEIPFDVIAFRKYCLLNGLDDIGLTLRHADKIRAFEAERLARHPWLDVRPVVRWSAAFPVTHFFERVLHEPPRRSASRPTHRSRNRLGGRASASRAGAPPGNQRRPGQ